MKSSKTIIFLVLLIGLALLLVNTNPSKKEFVEWFTNYVQNQADSKITKLLTKTVGKPLIDVSTTRKNYTFFSIFVIEDIQDTDIKYVGVLGQFINMENIPLN